eukprot:24061-Prorocentrum_minimum.AAC.1
MVPEASEEVRGMKGPKAAGSARHELRRMSSNSRLTNALKAARAKRGPLTAAMEKEETFGGTPPQTPAPSNGGGGGGGAQPAWAASAMRASAAVRASRRLSLSRASLAGGLTGLPRAEEQVSKGAGGGAGGGGTAHEAAAERRRATQAAAEAKRRAAQAVSGDGGSYRRACVV